MDFDLNIALEVDNFQEGEVETEDSNRATDSIKGIPSYTKEPLNADMLVNESSPIGAGNAVGGNWKMEEDSSNSSSMICRDIEKKLSVGSIVNDMSSVYFFVL